MPNAIVRFSITICGSRGGMFDPAALMISNPQGVADHGGDRIHNYDQDNAQNHGRGRGIANRREQLTFSGALDYDYVLLVLAVLKHGSVTSRASKQQSLQEGDIVMVSKDGAAFLTLFDGSTIKTTFSTTLVMDTLRVGEFLRRTKEIEISCAERLCACSELGSGRLCCVHP